MALLRDYLSGLNFPPVTILKQYLEDGMPEQLEPLTQCSPTDWCLKSSSESSRLRDCGNAACSTKKYDEALMYYSQSIAAAPTDSEELALAYGNRSAILQVQKEYELCLLDTNRALDGSLPQSSRMKLLERKAISWERLQEQNVNRMKLRAGLSNIKRSRQERASLMASERQLCYISKVDIDDTDLVIDRSRIDGPEFQTTFKNEISEYLSPKVQHRVDEEWGQVFIAAEDIEPGEILCNDDYYAVAVDECQRHQYCSHCGVWCKALIPCVSCCQDMYCSFSCREEAYHTYHETECKVLPLWGNVPVDLRMRRRLAARIFLTGTKQGSRLTTLLNDPEVYAALNGNLDHANVQYSSKDYLPILNTFWKLDEDMHDCSNQWQKIREALEMFVGLRYVKLFGDGEVKTQCSGNTLTDVELLAAVLLVHNLSLSLCRSYCTTAYFWEPEGDGPSIIRLDEIGAVVCSWRTFLNHSCNPNVRRLPRERGMLYFSVRPIKAGEQIYVSNGWYYTAHTREVRQMQFKQEMGRGCSCRACVEDWPLLAELLVMSNKYLTSKKDVIKRIEKMQSWVSNKLDEGSTAEDDLKKVCEFVKTIRRYVKEPSYTIILCELFLREAMRPKGTLYFSQKFIESLYDDL